MNKRSVVAVILAVVMLLASASFAFAEGEKTKVTIWHTFTEGQEAYLIKAATDFNASQDKYTVEVLSQPLKGFLDDVNKAVTGGMGPDIIFNYSSEAAQYIDLGLLADLSQFIYDDEIGIEGFDTCLGEGVMNGEVNAFSDGLIHYLPSYTTGPILFYNADMYNELGLKVPQNWDEMVANCKIIKEAKGIAGLGFDSLTDCLQMFCFEEGAGYIDVENKCVLFDTPEMRARIQWLVDCVKEGYFTIAPTGNYFSADFNSKIVASYIGSCAGYPYIEPDGFTFAMAPMPAPVWYPSWNRGPIAFYYSDDKTDIDDNRAEGVYEFIKYFISADVNVGWVQAVNALSPYAWTQETEEYKAYLADTENPSVQSLLAVAEHLDIAGSLPAVTGAATVRSAITAAVVKAVNGEMTVDEAWNECVILCNAALQGQ